MTRGPITLLRGGQVFCFGDEPIKRRDLLKPQDDPVLYERDLNVRPDPKGGSLYIDGVHVRRDPSLHCHSGVFTPVSHDDRLLVDGGLVSPLPITPLQNGGADFSIVVSLNGNSYQPPSVESDEPDTDDETNSPFRQLLGKARESLSGSDDAENDTGSVADIFSQSIETMQDRIAQYQLRDFKPDLLLEVPVDACGMLDFHRADEMIDLGYKLTVNALSRLRQGT